MSLLTRHGSLSGALAVTASGSKAVSRPSAQAVPVRPGIFTGMSGPSLDDLNIGFMAMPVWRLKSRFQLLTLLLAKLAFARMAAKLLICSSFT